MGGSDFHLERTDLGHQPNAGKGLPAVSVGRMEDKQMDLRMDIQPEYHYQGGPAAHGEGCSPM